VDLKKGISRKEYELDNNPSPCSYHPNINSIEKNDTSCNKYLFIYLAVIYKTEDKFKKKHYLVQKMWKSYNATIDYRIVQLKSYMEEQKDKKPIVK